MSMDLLKRYIGLAVRESQARVPTQLLQPDSGNDSEESAPEEEGVNEFCTAGAAMGFSAPAGVQKKTGGWKR